MTGAATGFLALRLYNVYLTKEYYGAIVVATNVLSYLPLVSGGFVMILCQQMLASRDSEETIKIARFAQALQSHILIVALLAGIGLMAIYSQMPVAHSSGLPFSLFFFIGLSAVATFYAGGQIGLLLGLGQQTYSIILTGGSSLLSFLIMWACFYLGLGVWAMPISSGLGAVLLLPVVWMLHQRFARGIPIVSWHRNPDFWQRLKATWLSSFVYLGCQFSIMLLFNVDIILAGVLFGPGAAAVYAIISRIAQLSRQTIQVLSETSWPKFAQEPDLQRKANLMRKIDRLNAWIGGSWHGAMLATLQPFLGWYMKAHPDWIAGPWLIGLMIARNLVEVLSAPHSYGLLSEARYKDIARSVQFEVILSVLGIFLFSQFLGLNGLALGVLVGTAGGALWYLTYLYFKHVHRTSWLTEWWAIYARGLGSAAIGFAVASLAWRGERDIFGAPGWASIVAGGLGLGASLAVAYWFGLKQSGGHTHLAGGWIRLPNTW